MKKLSLALAFVGMMAFAANAQTSNNVDTKKDAVSNSSETKSTKSCCANKDKKACKEAEGKACCKGKSAKECNHSDAGNKSHSEEGKETPSTKPSMK